MLKYEQIKEMIALFDQSHNQEMQLESGDFKLYLNKQVSSENRSLAQASDAGEPSKGAVESVATDQTTDQTAIQAPLVGSVYLQPAPDAPEFVRVGQTINPGDVVCVIEAMKMVTEVKSTVKGVITEVLVENEELVAYNQPLFYVKED